MQRSINKINEPLSQNLCQVSQKKILPKTISHQQSLSQSYLDNQNDIKRFKNKQSLNKHSSDVLSSTIQDQLKNTQKQSHKFESKPRNSQINQKKKIYYVRLDSNHTSTNQNSKNREIGYTQNNQMQLIPQQSLNLQVDLNTSTCSQHIYLNEIAKEDVNKENLISVQNKDDDLLSKFKQRIENELSKVRNIQSISKMKTYIEDLKIKSTTKEEINSLRCQCHKLAYQIIKKQLSNTRKKKQNIVDIESKNQEHNQKNSIQFRQELVGLEIHKTNKSREFQYQKISTSSEEPQSKQELVKLPILNLEKQYTSRSKLNQSNDFSDDLGDKMKFSTQDSLGHNSNESDENQDKSQRQWDSFEISPSLRQNDKIYVNTHKNQAVQQNSNQQYHNNQTNKNNNVSMSLSESENDGFNIVKQNSNNKFVKQVTLSKTNTEFNVRNCSNVFLYLDTKVSFHQQTETQKKTQNETNLPLSQMKKNIHTSQGETKQTYKKYFHNLYKILINNKISGLKSQKPDIGPEQQINQNMFDNSKYQEQEQIQEKYFKQQQNPHKEEEQQEPNFQDAQNQINQIEQELFQKSDNFLTEIIQDSKLGIEQTQEISLREESGEQMIEEILSEYQDFLEKENKKCQQLKSQYFYDKKIQHKQEKIKTKALEGVKDIKLGVKMFQKNIYIYEKNTFPFLKGCNLFQDNLIKFIINWCQNESQLQERFPYKIIVDLSIQDQLKGFFNQILLRPDGYFRDGSLQLISKFTKKPKEIFSETENNRSKDAYKAMEFSLVNLNIVKPETFYEEISLCNKYLKDKTFDYEQIELEYFQRKCQESLNYEFKLVFEKSKMTKQLVGALNSLAQRTIFIFGIQDIDNYREIELEQYHPSSNEFTKKNISTSLDNYMQYVIDIIKEDIMTPTRQEIKVWKKQNEVSVQIGEEKILIKFQALKISEKLYPIKIVVPSSQNLIMMKSHKYRNLDYFHNYTYVRQNASVNVIFGYQNEKVCSNKADSEEREINNYYKFKQQFLSRINNDN